MRLCCICVPRVCVLHVYAFVLHVYICVCYTCMRVCYTCMCVCVARVCVCVKFTKRPKSTQKRSWCADTNPSGGGFLRLPFPWKQRYEALPKCRKRFNTWSPSRLTYFTHEKFFFSLRLLKDFHCPILSQMTISKCKEIYIHASHNIPCIIA